MSESFTAFDVIVLLIVGGSLVYAFARGFTTMALTAAAWLGAILVTLYASPHAARFASGYIEPESLAGFIAVPLVFIVSLIALKLVANAIGRRMRTGPAGVLDRSLGAALGFLLGAVVVSAVYLLFAGLLSEDRHPEWVREARLRPLVAYGATMVAKAGPELFSRIDETPGGDVLLERIRRNYGTAREQAESVAETAYREGARRLMDRKLQEVLEESSPAGPETDDGGG